MERLLSARQICRHPNNPNPILPVGPSKFYQMVNDGTIAPPIKMGRLSLWPEDVILAVVKRITAGEFDDGKIYGRPRKIERKLAKDGGVETVEDETST